MMYFGLELVTRWSWVDDVFWDWNLLQCGAGLVMFLGLDLVKSGAGLVMYFGIGTCHKAELGW